MKHTYFTLFFCLLSLLLGSCDKNVDDFYPPYNYNYYLGMADWHLHKKPEVITHNFASSFIFGDDEMHELVSYWKFDSMYKKADLVRVTIDNVDARIEMDTYKFQSLAILTLK